jgi:hypothetical protein
VLEATVLEATIAEVDNDDDAASTDEGQVIVNRGRSVTTNVHK